MTALQAALAIGPTALAGTKVQRAASARPTTFKISGVTRVQSAGRATHTHRPLWLEVWSFFPLES